MQSEHCNTSIYLTRRFESPGVYLTNQIGLCERIEMVLAKMQPVHVAVIGIIRHGLREIGEEMPEVALAGISVDSRTEGSRSYALLSHRESIGVTLKIPFWNR